MREGTHWSKIPKGHVAFTYQEPDTGKIYLFDITGIQRDYRTKLRPVVNIDVDPEFAKFSLTNRGIERHRLAPLYGEEIREPILVAIWGDGGHVVLDGNHRYVATALKGQRWIRARLLPRSIWGKHLIVGAPPEFHLLGGFSGIMPQVGGGND
jgi:hypothetical protein